MVQIDETTSSYDREKPEERPAKLIGGVVVINVGAPAETAMKERKDRLEDALNATRAGNALPSVIGCLILLNLSGQLINECLLFFV